MVKKTKTSRKKKTGNDFQLDHVLAGLDLMLAGHNSVVGQGFLLEKRVPFPTYVGHYNPDDLQKFDQAFVDLLINTESREKIIIPDDLNSLCQIYREQRDQLSAYYEKATSSLLDQHDITAAKELGNFDVHNNKILIENNAEMNIFFDYITLYQKFSHQRNIVSWRQDNPAAITKDNKAVVSALEKAKFSLLRLDEILLHGAMRVTNLFTQKEGLLIDRALNASTKKGFFFICSALDLGDYIMTSGGGIPIDPTSPRGKSTLTLFKPYFEALQTIHRPFTHRVSSCARKIYGFCLKNDALVNMTIQ